MFRNCAARTEYTPIEFARAGHVRKIITWNPSARIATLATMAWQYVLLCLSAVLAGAVNSVAGGGTLLTFPVLLAVLTHQMGSEKLASVVANACIHRLPALRRPHRFRFQSAPLRRCFLG